MRVVWAWKLAGVVVGVEVVMTSLARSKGAVWADGVCVLEVVRAVAVFGLGPGFGTKGCANRRSRASWELV